MKGRQPQARVFGPGEGSRTWWFLGSRMALKAGGNDTSGSFTLFEQTMPPGFSPPDHVHLDEEEVFGIFEGHLQVRCGEQSWIVGPGDTVLLPRGVRHGFSVTGPDAARIWHLTAPAKFERFVEHLGVEAGPGLPGEMPIDVAEVTSVAATFGYEILAPAGVGAPAANGGER